MIASNADHIEPRTEVPAGALKMRLSSQSSDPAGLADVYQENINIAIWQRELSAGLRDRVDEFLASNASFKSAMTVSPRSAPAAVSDALGAVDDCALCGDISELVEMFCCLLGVERAGLRLGVLNAAMCPKFHVDRVPCRLVTTYQGCGTEWLQHNAVDRTKLGPGSRGKSDQESGLFKTPGDIQRLSCGDVALLKGELWEGNADAGLVHRSPEVSAGEPRLLLTLDVSG